MTAALVGGEWSAARPRPHFTPGEDPVPIVQEAGCAAGPVWTGGKSRPHRHSIPDLRARSQPLYRLSYTAQSDDSNSVNLNTFGPMNKLILGALTKLPKVTISFVMSVCLSVCLSCRSVRVEQLGPNRTDFYEI
jgi:hypothetical protein